ncbi:MAG: hypothetical protein QOJ05_1964 [Verrucomicrobiota bacterium]
MGRAGTIRLVLSTLTPAHRAAATVERRRARYLLDVDLAHVLLHANRFDRIPQFVGEPDVVWNSFKKDEWSGQIGGSNFDVFQAEHAREEGL